MQIVESNDDVNMSEVKAPGMASRDFSIDFETFKDTGFTLEELPDPTLWRCLIFPKQHKVTTKSGILLAKSATDAEEALQYIGQVIKIGPLAGRNKNYENPDYRIIHNPMGGMSSFSAEEPQTNGKPRWSWNIQVNDWVMYGKFTGLKVEYKGKVLLLVNDDEIVSRLESPFGYKVYL